MKQLNAEDGGNRRFICVQLPEKTDEQSEAYKAGYKTICEIGKERIRRAGEKIKEENRDKEGIENLDIGFKVFKLDSSNLVKWDNTPTTDEEEVKKRIQQSLSSLSIDQSWFVTSSSKRSRYQDKTGEEKSSSIYGNILYAFKNFYKHDKLFIDIDSDSNFEDDGLHITQSTYKDFVKIFPTATNVKYQTLSIFTKLLKSELDVVDYEEIYSRYKSREISVRNKEDIKTEEICKQEKVKYIYAKVQLLKSLERSAAGVFIHEDEFSKLIAQIFCFLNPKYVKIQTKLNISDYTGARANCQADLSLIDCEGNIDLIEVKSPQAYPNLFRKRQYRNHYVPSGELSGAINQLEQYLKCLTKMTTEEISNKNPALQNEMGEIKLKAVHPKGYIIFGRDAASFNGDNINQKKLDFELIKNTYKDVVDIITFDELVQRFDRIISFL